MAQSIVFNNATYIIPDVGESSWGQNLTNYFVAIASGAYQLSGGTAPLTADLSFGSNYGLFAKYLTSVTANPATAGVLRLAKTDAVEWRNNANGANLALSIDTSNNLLWNGDVVATSSASPVLSIAGTSNEITASAATGNVTLSIPSTFIAPGSIAATTTLAGTAATFSNTTNQLVLGTTHTVTISSTAPSGSLTYTLPDAGGSANIVLDAGDYTIAGTWGFSNTITLASSKAIVFTDDSTNTVTLKATNSTTSYTLSLPTTHGTNGYFLQTDGSGNTTWAAGGSGSITSGTAGNITLYPGSSNTVSDTYVQNTKNITIGIAAQSSRSANLAITIPNPGNAVTTTNIMLTDGAQTVNGAITMANSATIAMGSSKITGLANGSSSTDAAAFGQVNATALTGLSVAVGTITSSDTALSAIGKIAYSRVVQVVMGTSSTVHSTTSSSFVATNLTASITPKSSSNTVLILVCAYGDTSASGNAEHATLYRGSGGTELSGQTGGFAKIVGVSSGELVSSLNMAYVDSPATTSATAYYAYHRNENNVTSVDFGVANMLQVMILIELGA